MSTPSIFSAIKKLRTLLTRQEKLKWLGIFLFALCTSLLELLTAFIIVLFAQVLTKPDIGQKYLSKIGFAPDLSPSRVVFYVAVIVGVVYLIKNIVAAIEVFYQNFSIQKMNYNFKSKLLRIYSESNYLLYLSRNASTGYNIMEGDVHQMFSAGMVSFASIISEGIVFISLTTMLIVIDPSVSIIIFALGTVVSLFVIKVLFPQFYRWGVDLQKAGEMSTKNLLQFLHGFKEIVLLGKRESFILSYQEHSRKKSHLQSIQSATNSLPRMIIEVLFVGLFVATIAILCYENETPVQMIGILGGYLYAGFRIMPGLNRIINQLNNFKSIIPSIERVYTEYYNMTEKENYIDMPNFAFNKSIVLKDVSFGYPNTAKDALKNINLEIKKGDCIGIVGETGSGKSTLVDIILGLLKPYRGQILIDGMYPVNSYQWHKRIGYVPQSIYLTDDTIEANIAFGEKPDEIDFLRINKAIEDSQLKNFISQLPSGSKTIIGERGIRLSGGERQRISIARALYRNPEVLIFDEATSALDHETENRLMETIHAVSKTRTVIMIAHRLSTLKKCDIIIDVQQGETMQVKQNAV